MQSMVCKERPDCCDVIEVKYKWINNFDNINDLIDYKETKDYNRFIDKLNDNTISGSSLGIYSRHVLKYKNSN